MTLPELDAEVLARSPDVRARLPERLLDSFETDNEVERAWIAEALRREEDVKAGRSTMVPGDEALRRARARIE